MLFEIHMTRLFYFKQHFSDSEAILQQTRKRVLYVGIHFGLCYVIIFRVILVERALEPDKKNKYIFCPQEKKLFS